MLENSFPEKGKKKEYILDEIYKAKKKNMSFGSGKILGSMCTEPLELSKKVHSMFLESNLGNPGLCKGVQELEENIHTSVASLIHADSCESLSVGGATEGNILALWKARETSGKRKVLLPESAHFSFVKACSLLDMEPKYIPLTDDYTLDIEILKRELDDDTAAVVGIAGTTELGVIDPIEKIAKIAGDTYLHVDAAFGGFVIPFLRELGEDLPKYDFEVKGVNSLVLDPHKMGLSTVPLGLFFSEDGHNLSIKSPYLTGGKQKTIRGTRSSASVPAFWTAMNLLGKEGYKEIVAECMENTHYMINRMEEIGLEPVIEPVMNIASFHCDESEKIVKKVKEKGWNISLTVNPPGLRFVMMPHVRKDSIDKITKIIGDII
ncbi:MAG: tyrosine decarboxylase MfnA [Thermoplasmatota archaeon]